MHLTRTAALLAALLGCGCRGLPAPVEPRGPASALGAADPFWLQEDAYLQASGVAAAGAPSATPELDAIAALASATTPEAGLAPLLVAAVRDAPPARLRPGDLLALEVYGRPELSGERRIGPEGSIPLALLGPLAIAGMTESEASAAVAREVARLARAPQVQVRLLQPAPASVRVVGRVASPGLHALPQERAFECLELIARCGGLLDDADVEHLALLRGDPEDGRLRAHHFTYSELLASQTAGQVALLSANDVLVIPRLPDVYVFGRVTRAGAFPLRPGATVASLLLQSGVSDGASARDIQVLRGATARSAELTRELAAGDVVFVPERRRVYLVGEGVGKNGPIDLPGTGLTVVQALAAAGWLTRHADIDRVEVLRHRGGQSARFAIPLRQILSGEVPESDYALEPGDVVHVPETVW